MIEKPIKVVAVCGCGMGSSVILRMNAEEVFSKLGINAIVEVADATTGKGAARGADLIVVSSELIYLFKEAAEPVISLTSFVDKKEIYNKLHDWALAKGLIHS